MNVGYGIGDWAEEVTWRIIPEFYRAEDGTEGQVPEPLRGFIDAIKPLFNEWIKLWRAFPSLWDAQFVPLDQLNKLAQTVGTEVDSTKPERLQRSEVLNQAFLVLNKGTDQGYTILAAFEDLLVEIIPLWAENKEPGAALTATDPTRFIPHYDDIPADEIPTDLEFSDRFARWPQDLHLDEDCRTYRLRLVFSPTDNPTQDFNADVADRITARLLRFTPIHVIIDRVTFDGIRGSSQTWTVADLVADNAAVGMWTGPVVGLQQAASATWTTAVVGTPTP